MGFWNWFFVFIIKFVVFVVWKFVVGVSYCIVNSVVDLILYGVVVCLI